MLGSGGGCVGARVMSGAQSHVFALSPVLSLSTARCAKRGGLVGVLKAGLAGKLQPKLTAHEACTACCCWMRLLLDCDDSVLVQLHWGCVLPLAALPGGNLAVFVWLTWVTVLCVVLPLAPVPALVLQATHSRAAAPYRAD